MASALRSVSTRPRCSTKNALASSTRQSAAQVGAQLEPLVRGDVHLVAELGVAVATGAVGLVQGDVCVAQQVLRGFAVAGGDADAGGDGDRGAGAEVERLLQDA